MKPAGVMIVQIEVASARTDITLLRTFHCRDAVAVNG
jgi:hypothetical protein